MRFAPIASLLLAFLAASAALAQGYGLEEAKALVADGQYPQALQKITQLLALKGPAAQGVNRYELYMLKGECHLRTRGSSLALDAYARAAREAKAEPDRARAAAHELLLRRSPGFAYKPKAPPAPASATAPRTPPAPIDILEPESRKRAFAALLDDDLAALAPKAKAAQSAKSLLPVLDLVQAARGLEGVETAATGKTDRVGKLFAGLGEHSRTLISDALRTMARRVDAIDKDANTFVEFYQDVLDPRYPNSPRIMKRKAYKRKGLTDPQVRDLREVDATCEKLGPAAEMLARGLGADGKGFETQVAEADRLRKEVARLFDVDYTRVFDSIPGKK